MVHLKKGLTVSIFDDINSLRDHIKKRRDWYIFVIERVETDIQKVWAENLKDENLALNGFKIQELGKSFDVLREGLQYFREALLRTEKRLEELNEQEYALKRKKIFEVN